MLVSRLFLAAIVLGMAFAPAYAAEKAQRACLSKAEQRAAVAAKQAVPLAQVVKSMRQCGRRAELVRARLCHRDEKVVYVLTLLAHSGKVTLAIVDAANGDFINGR
jgi:hypothetical protein